MKLFIKRFSLFLSVFLICFVVFTALWGEFAPEYFQDNLKYGKLSSSFINNRFREAEKTKNIDIMVVGASQAYRGFDPRVFNNYGISIFNLGSSNQTQVQTEFMVKKYLKQFSPKIVLFVVNHESFSMDGIESSIDLISHGFIDWHTFVMASKVNSIRSWFTLTYAVYRSLLNRDKGFVHPNELTNDKYISGGYVQKNYHPFWGSKLEDRIKWKARPFQKRAFKNTIRFFKKNEVEVILIQAPHEESLFKKIQYKEEYNAFYESFNCQYLNYNELLPFSREYFYDHFHLNQQGVEKFNLDLIDRLNLKKQLNK